MVREYPDRFKEGKKKPRLVLQYKKIPHDDYIFASCVKSNWRISNETNNRAKLLITKEWVDNFLSAISTVVEEPVQSTLSREVQEAPPVLELKESEKFKDKEGKVLEIEVRGEREEDSCFFRVKDVQTCFKDLRLYDNLTLIHTSYQEVEDYVYFYRPYPVGSTEVIETKKELFFTYQGILKYMFISKNENTKSFRKWATRILFAKQMGTEEQKQSIVSELIGVPIDTTIRFMKACVKDIPLVYMLHLGVVPEKIQIKDGVDRNDYFFCKIGGHGFDKETKQGFQGRCKGHQKEFKEFKNEMSYLHFVFIDPMYVSEAERSIKTFLKEFRVDYNNKAEVYMIPKTKMEDVKKFFEKISNLYSGNASDIQREVDRFKHQTESRILELEKENDHLRDKLGMFQKLVDDLKERIKEQASFIAEQAGVVKMFLSRFST